MNLKNIFLSTLLFVILACTPNAADKKKAEDRNNQSPLDITKVKTFFKPNELHTITIEISDSEWDKLVDKYASNDKRKIKFIYEGPASAEKIVLDEVGFRVKGNTTREKPGEGGKNRKVTTRVHYKIDFNEPFNLKEGTTEYEERKDRRFQKLRAMYLKSEREDTTLIREQFAYSYLNEKGIYTSQVSNCKLYIKIGDSEKQYVGHYTMIEPIDKSFLTRRYGKDGNDGNLYKCLWQNYGPANLHYDKVIENKAIGIRDLDKDYKPAYNRKTNKENTNYSDLKNFAKNLKKKSGSALKSYLDKNFNIETFLRWVACNQLLGMPDDYWAMGNNYYLYFPNRSNEKIEFIPYDYDHGLGRGWGGPLEDFDKIKTANIYEWFQKTDVNPTPLITKVLAIPEYKKRYEEYLKELTTQQAGESMVDLYDSYLESRLEELNNDAVLKDTVVGDMTMEKDVVQRQFIIGRVANVRQQLKLEPEQEPTPPPYESPINNNNETYTFVFDPEYYSLKGTLTHVYIRGEVNNFGWEKENSDNKLTLEDGVYSITTNASSGQKYKYFVKYDDDTNDWFLDCVNNLTNGSGPNSLVP